MSLEKIFHLKENNTTVKTEIMAGVTSFMTMAYILAVNPNILAAAYVFRSLSSSQPSAISLEPAVRRSSRSSAGRRILTRQSAL